MNVVPLEERLCSILGLDGHKYVVVDGQGAKQTFDTYGEAYSSFEEVIEADSIPTLSGVFSDGQTIKTNDNDAAMEDCVEDGD